MIDHCSSGKLGVKESKRNAWDLVFTAVGGSIDGEFCLYGYIKFETVSNRMEHFFFILVNKQKHTKLSRLICCR